MILTVIVFIILLNILLQTIIKDNNKWITYLRIINDLMYFNLNVT